MIITPFLALLLWIQYPAFALSPNQLMQAHNQHRRHLKHDQPNHSVAKRLSGSFIGESTADDSDDASRHAPEPGQGHPLRAGFLQWDMEDFTSSKLPCLAGKSSRTDSSSTELETSVIPQRINVIQIQTGVAGGNQATLQPSSDNGPAPSPTSLDDRPTTPSSAAPRPPPPTTTGQSSSSSPSPVTSSSSTAESAPSDPSPSSGPDAWVRAHNEYRKQYQASDLSWSDGLSQKAKSNAELCTHSHTNTGENIAWGPGMTPDTVLGMWMSEAPLYDWKKPEYLEPAGHFTQVIWADSRQVGCFVANCPDGGQQATCEYDPIGNYINPGQFEKNVKPKAG